MYLDHKILKLEDYKIKIERISDMIDPIEKALHQRFLLNEGVILEVGAADPVWLKEMLSTRPLLKGRSLAPDSKQQNNLDAWSAGEKIRRINCLQISDPAAVVPVINGAANLLNARAIDLVQFEQGPELATAHAALTSRGYTVFSLNGGKMTHLAQVPANYEQSGPIRCAAVVPRVLRSMATDKSILNTPGLLAHYKIKARGMIHIGAHLGEELPMYQQMGFAKILLVEANPELAATIKKNIENQPNVIIANVAASDSDGSISLRVTSMDQSSSILPLKRHRNYYPSVTETRQVTVPARRLGTLLTELNQNPADYNCMSVDIQGAELRAFRGCGDLLKQMDFIETEVNYEELYEGCGLIDDLDDLFATYGFTRVDVSCPFHPSWGDAAYVRL